MALIGLSAVALAGCDFDIDFDVEAEISVERDDETIRSLDPDLDLRSGTITLPTGESIEVLYSVRNGEAFLTEDILLGPADALEQDPGFRSAAIDAWAWPNATIVYRLDSSLDEDHRLVMQAAMQEWTEATGLQFEEAADDALGGFVRIQSKENGCFATLGAPGPYEEHRLNIGPGCNSLATWRHEFGHTIGLMHEQARSDRDDHVFIDWDNIAPNYAYAFDRYEARGIPGVDRGPYDFASVMHYRSFSFARDKSRPTIWARDGSLITRDDSTPISAGDAAAVIGMYGLPDPNEATGGEDVGAGSCLNACGPSTAISDAEGGLCYCDKQCAELGDCCGDYIDQCGTNDGPTCSGRCGDAHPVDNSCYCDDQCEDYGDCCDDYADACIAQEPTCVGHCGSEDPIGGCYCDAECEAWEDCCSDYTTVCE